jgi:hypothetical protein
MAKCTLPQSLRLWAGTISGDVVTFVISASKKAEIGRIKVPGQLGQIV